MNKQHILPHEEIQNMIRRYEKSLDTVVYFHNKGNFIAEKNWQSWANDLLAHINDHISGLKAMARRATSQNILDNLSRIAGELETQIVCIQQIHEDLKIRKEGL